METLENDKSRLGEPLWVPVRAKSVGHQIVQQVRDAMFAGDLKPGDLLGSEKDLAAEFGVSRITIRDALRTLETMGIVEIRVGAGGGARIAAGNIDHFADALAVQLKLSGITIDEMFGAQIAIEGAAADAAARHRSDADLARLQRLLGEAADLKDDPAGFTRSGHEFHLAVAEASGNRALVAQFKALRHVVWPNGTPRTNREIADRVLRLHTELYALIDRRDGAGARELMCRHLESIRQTGFAGTDAAAAPDVLCC